MAEKDRPVPWWETRLGQVRMHEFAAQGAEAARLRAAAAAGRKNRRQMHTMQRMYASARSPTYSEGWAVSDGSADSEIISSIVTVRSRARALVRDNSYAKRAVTVIINNVIGSGVGMQAQVMNSRGELRTSVNDEIEDRWAEFCDAENCHTGGRLQFRDYERAKFAQIVEAGECLTRKHSREFGPMRIPFCLELVEAERIADDYGAIAPGMLPTNHVRLGIEVNEFIRPQAYFLRQHHKGEIRITQSGTNFVERVPADSIRHLAMIDRWPQTRGMPWFHTTALRLQDMDGYSEAEMVRARGQAVRLGIIESPEDTKSMGDEVEDDGTPVLNMDPGTVQRLVPGEKWIDSSPNAPNPQLDPFMRYMLREVAAGVGCSYESLSRDYSQSNYSSSRLALLDDRDLWRFFQCWYIGNFRYQIHRDWLRMAVLSRKIESISVAEYAADPRKFEQVLFKPRGWTWIDPTKEVQAYCDAVKYGFTTVSDVIAQTAGGMDIEDVLRIRARELQMMKDAGLEFETSPAYYMADANKAKAEAKAAAAKPGADAATVAAASETTTGNAPQKTGRAVLGVAR